MPYIKTSLIALFFSRLKAAQTDTQRLAVEQGISHFFVRTLDLAPPTLSNALNDAAKARAFLEEKAMPTKDQIKQVYTGEITEWSALESK